MNIAACHVEFASFSFSLLSPSMLYYEASCSLLFFFLLFFFFLARKWKCDINVKVWDWTPGRPLIVAWMPLNCIGRIMNYDTRVLQIGNVLYRIVSNISPFMCKICVHVIFTVHLCGLQVHVLFGHHRWWRSLCFKWWWSLLFYFILFFATLETHAFPLTQPCPLSALLKLGDEDEPSNISPFNMIHISFFSWCWFTFPSFTKLYPLSPFYPTCGDSSPAAPASVRQKHRFIEGP